MGNKKGNGVKGKYMENMDYIIKNIDKLEDLNGFKWKYKKFDFTLKRLGSFLSLNHMNAIDLSGALCGRQLRCINLQNLTELKFYGLKVVLNEKPKLTMKERYLLECHGDIYIARDKEGILYLYTKEPREQQYPDMWLTDDGIGLILSDDIFNFITWESGKAWGKAELMELEVME